MSRSETDEPSIPGRMIDTVTPPYRGRPDAEMSTIGWALFLGTVILLVPLLPFLVVVWLIGELLDRVVG